MVLRDLIYQKKMLKEKIVELKAIIYYDNSETITQELFVQLELLQAKKVNLSTINNQVKIDLGGKEVVVSTAVIIRDTMKEKMDILTALITNSGCKLNKLDLMKQRDGVYEEYALLSHKITANDLSVRIGE
jgi:hypothetical protein